MTRLSINGGMAMGATLCMLNNQWDKAVKARDWALVDRLDDAIDKIKPLGVPARCVWAGSDTCRMCVAPESGKCPMIHVDVAA